MSAGAAADAIRAARADAMRRTQDRRQDAEAAWQRLLALVPGDPEAHYALGQSAGDRGEFAAAIAHFRTALARMPSHPQLRASLALALEETGATTEAEVLWRALAADTRGDATEIRAQLARNLFRQQRYPDALAIFDALDRRGRLAHPLLRAAYAACLASVGRSDDAERAFGRALAAGADAPGVRREFAAFLIRQRRYQDAADVLDAGGAGSADDLLAQAMLLACRQQLADWRDFAALRDRVIAGVAAGSRRSSDIVPAFDFIAVCDDPLLQRAAARGWSESAVAGVSPVARPPRATRAKVRLGFVSSDFGDHPVGRLVVALLERLDRQAFEVYAFVTADEARDAVRLRVERAVDRFATLDRRDPAACARALAAADIDVLFDLNGLSGGEALRIFAQRPARLQMSFLGYTGTLGLPAAYDGLVADTYCVPLASRDACDERAVTVDPCYLPSDPQRLPDPAELDRAVYGLPAGGIVFGAFAAVYKIVPELFDVWMQLLRDVPDSVLWLRHMPADRTLRLRAEALARGVASERLVVAPRDPVPRYLARFALADLFLDSVPFGSHTTVNDALFMGLPVVTLAGASFAGRASASQVAAMGAEAQIAADLAHYHRIALHLATDASARAAAAARLRDAAARAPLFDADAFARRFEAAILHAFRASCAGPGDSDAVARGSA